MNIGILKEIRPKEFRVPLTPEAVRRIVDNGHHVVIEKGAGESAGFPDSEYASAGGKIVNFPADVVAQSELIVKVKEPLPEEVDAFQKNQTLMCFIKIKSEKQLLDMLAARQMTAFSFQHIREKGVYSPLLAPLSVIAGQQAVLQGMQFLWNHNGGIGKSMVLYPGLEPFQVVILGCGIVGVHAARVAAALGAEVNMFEVDQHRIESVYDHMPAGIRMLNLAHVQLAAYVQAADMVINTATVPANNPFHIVTRDMVAQMKPGSIIVDVTANIRGAIETIDRETTHDNPVWKVGEVFHYAVRNITGTVANTASKALSMALMPYLMEIANLGVSKAIETNPALKQGAVIIDGHLQ